jgi:hypothetical protein
MKKAMENEEMWRRSGRMSAVVVADDWLRAGHRFIESAGSELEAIQYYIHKAEVRKREAAERRQSIAVRWKEREQGARRKKKRIKERRDYVIIK